MNIKTPLKQSSGVLIVSVLAGLPFIASSSTAGARTALAPFAKATQDNQDGKY